MPGHLLGFPCKLPSLLRPRELTGSFFCVRGFLCEEAAPAGYRRGDAASAELLG